MEQDLSVETDAYTENPETGYSVSLGSISGAECVLERNNQIIGKVVTPATIRVRKTKDHIKVKCKKEGYKEGMGYFLACEPAPLFPRVLFPVAISSCDTVIKDEKAYDDYAYRGLSVSMRKK